MFFAHALRWERLAGCPCSDCSFSFVSFSLSLPLYLSVSSSLSLPLLLPPSLHLFSFSFCFCSFSLLFSIPFLSAFLSWPCRSSLFPLVFLLVFFLLLCLLLLLLLLFFFWFFFFRQGWRARFFDIRYLLPSFFLFLRVALSSILGAWESGV